MKYFAKTRISENIHETPEGYLLCLGVPITRPGDFDYAAHELPKLEAVNGKIIVTQSEEEVFRPETLASYEGKGIVITHPEEFLNPDNHASLAKGTLQNLRRGEGEFKDDLLGDLLLTDSVAINLVKAGLREVSAGYDATYTQTEPGRAVRTQIIGNHLALVDEGRAGPTYSINDHKGKGTLMKLGETIRSIFTKAGDEAAKAVETSVKTTDAAEVVGKGAPATPLAQEGVKVWDEMKGTLDSMTKMVGDLSAKLDGMKGKDAGSPQDPQTGKPAEVVATDADPAAGSAPSVEDRLSKLETAIATLLQAQTGDADESEEEETGDADESEEEETGDEKEEKEEGAMVGDAAGSASDIASRVEILAPGAKLKGDAKVVKLGALKIAYATTDGKKTIDAITAGKGPTTENADVIFVAASELLKRDRSSVLSRTKTKDFASAFDDHAVGSTVMTAEKMNEMNAKHYANRAQ